jgi:hypothetical protein
MSSFRKIKKKVKATKNQRFIRSVIADMKSIKYWKKINHLNSKSNMKVLTKNFYWRGMIVGNF